jgi:hypothetical protein
MWHVGENTTIEDCHFIGNHGRVVNLRDQFITVTDNWFQDNETRYSGGCLSVSDVEGTIKYNTMVNNTHQGTGSGMVYVTSDWLMDLRGKTLSGNKYSAGASTTGFLLDIDHGFYFMDNIVAGCVGGVAVKNSGDTHPWNRCNVFWNNEAGHFIDYIPHETDQIADPMFCNPEALDLTVHSDSPCAEGNTPECGQIGAWSVGCGGTAVPPNAEPMSWGRVKERYRGGR